MESISYSFPRPFKGILQYIFLATRHLLRDFIFDLYDYAHAILEISQIKEKLTLSLDHTHWKFGCIDINLLVLAPLVTKQLSIPLLWKALPKKGMFSQLSC